MIPRLSLRLTLGLLTLLMLLTAVRPAAACTVPVFRYALERWPADPYEVLIYVRGDEGDEVTKLVDQLDEAREAHPLYANVEPRVIDVDHADDAEADGLLQPWREAGEPDLPWVAVTYPYTRHGPMPAFLPPRQSDTLWTGKPADLASDRLIDSPARREIARRLLKGDSTVWILVESGDPAADDAAMRQLDHQLRRLEGVLELPEIAESDQRYISEDGPELKLAFSTMRLSRKDSAEAAFLRMIDHMEAGIPTDQPVIVPVYGRGRLLCALPAPPLHARLRVPTPMGYRTLLDASVPAMMLPEAVDQMAVFLTGECSCEVKGLNPGTDALMAAGWDNFIDGSFVIDEEMPSLTSLPAFTAEDFATAQLPATPVKAPQPVSLQNLANRALGDGGDAEARGEAEPIETVAVATPAPEAAAVNVANRSASAPTPVVAAASADNATAAVRGGLSSVMIGLGVVAAIALVAVVLGSVLLMRRGTT